MMTRKVFKAVAEILAAAMIPDETRAALVAEFCKVFKASNPRFDKARFVDAATPVASNY